MRYGTIPIVRAVGGLKDTVPDIGEPDGSGRGIRFDQFSVEDVTHALYRAASMWHDDPKTVERLRERIMAIDFSWEKTIERYFAVYRGLGAYIEHKPVSLSVEKPAPGADAPEKMPKPVPEKQTVKKTPAPKTKSAASKPAAPKKASGPKKQAKKAVKPAAPTPKPEIKAPDAKPAEKPAAKPKRKTPKK